MLEIERTILDMRKIKYDQLDALGIEHARLDMLEIERNLLDMWKIAYTQSDALGMDCIYLDTWK